MIESFDVNKAYAVLELERKIVGVKLVHSKQEYDKFEGKELKSSISYCVGVKTAMKGIPIKLTKNTSGCAGSSRALGLTKPTEDFYNGKSGYDLGLYENQDISASVSKRMKICEPKTYGVIIKPLELFEAEPDVVLIVANNKNVMRIIQGYTYMYGMQPNFSLTGNQAVCVECTSYPIITDDLNISLFCSGTRFLAKWKDTEMEVGIPYHKFSKVIEGVRLTVNAVEMENRKKEIKDKLEKLRYDGSEIIFNHTYYLDLEREKQNKKREKQMKELYLREILFGIQH